MFKYSCAATLFGGAAALKTNGGSAAALQTSEKSAGGYDFYSDDFTPPTHECFGHGYPTEEWNEETGEFQFFCVTDAARDLFYEAVNTKNHMFHWHPPVPEPPAEAPPATGQPPPPPPPPATEQPPPPPAGVGPYNATVFGDNPDGTHMADGTTIEQDTSPMALQHKKAKKLSKLAAKKAQAKAMSKKHKQKKVTSLLSASRGPEDENYDPYGDDHMHHENYGHYGDEHYGMHHDPYGHYGDMHMYDEFIYGYYGAENYGGEYHYQEEQEQLCTCPFSPEEIATLEESDPTIMAFFGGNPQRHIWVWGVECTPNICHEPEDPYWWDATVEWFEDTAYDMTHWNGPEPCQCNPDQYEHWEHYVDFECQYQQNCHPDTAPLFCPEPQDYCWCEEFPQTYWPVQCMPTDLHCHGDSGDFCARLPDRFFNASSFECLLDGTEEDPRHSPEVYEEVCGMYHGADYHSTDETFAGDNFHFDDPTICQHGAWKGQRIGEAGMNITQICPHCTEHEVVCEYGAEDYECKTSFAECGGLQKSDEIHAGLEALEHHHLCPEDHHQCPDFTCVPHGYECPDHEHHPACLAEIEHFIAGTEEECNGYMTHKAEIDADVCTVTDSIDCHELDGFVHFETCEEGSGLKECVFEDGNGFHHECWGIHEDCPEDTSQSIYLDAEHLTHCTSDFAHEEFCGCHHHLCHVQTHHGPEDMCVPEHMDCGCLEYRVEVRSAFEAEMQNGTTHDPLRTYMGHLARAFGSESHSYCHSDGPDVSMHQCMHHCGEIAHGMPLDTCHEGFSEDPHGFCEYLCDVTVHGGDAFEELCVEHQNAVAPPALEPPVDAPPVAPEQNDPKPEAPPPPASPPPVEEPAADDTYATTDDSGFEDETYPDYPDEKPEPLSNEINEQLAAKNDEMRGKITDTETTADPMPPTGPDALMDPTGVNMNMKKAKGSAAKKVAVRAASKKSAPKKKSFLHKAK